MNPVKHSQRSQHAGKERIVIDCAGAVQGGAARFLKELQLYLNETQPPNVQLIGLGRQLTMRWLVHRELIAASATRRIALNNVGFINPRGENITLLRNILQFATDKDFQKLSFSPSLRLRVQTPVVRTVARASDVLVVPCTRMAEKVASTSNFLKDKLLVRFHPVSRSSWAGEEPQNPYDVLLPIVPAPYKNLDQHITAFLEASSKLNALPLRLIVCSQADSFPELASHPRIKFIGPQTAEQLDIWWRNSGAIFFPPEFEAFGYPLAEARVYGRSVIAPSSSQSSEIAGEALHSYRRDDISSMTAAIEAAICSTARPDPEPFDPAVYFAWLLGGCANRQTGNRVDC